MSFLSRMKHGASGIKKHALSDRSGSKWSSGTGPGGFVVDKVERYGGAYAFGFLKGYYRERMLWCGFGADLWAGAGLTLLGAGLSIASGGRSGLAPHLERFGDAGVSSYFNSMGASAGAKKAGRSVYVLESGAKAPPGLKPTDVLGMIPPAMGGAYLTADEIAQFSARK